MPADRSSVSAPVSAGVLAIVGWHNSGKTTLMVKLVAELTSRGYTISTIKHAHHEFDVDRPGKDSFLHRQAGAQEVMVGSAARWALMHELREADEPGLDELLAHMETVDLILVEGFKNAPIPKIEVYRPGASDDPLIAASDPHVVAVVSDAPANLPELNALNTPLLDTSDLPALADFVVAHCHLQNDRDAPA